MQVEIVHQRVGQDRVFEVLEQLLDSDTFDRVRVLVAFARAPGLGLVYRALAQHLDRGRVAEAIIGLDLGGTTPEALTALHALGVETHVFGVDGDRTFHPKAYIFESSTSGEFAALIGSSNLTAGGLDSNFELNVLVRGTRGASQEDDDLLSDLELVWGTYREPSQPLGAGHLRQVDDDLIDELASSLGSESEAPPDSGGFREATSIFDPVQAPREPRRRVPTTRARTETTAAGGALPETLYLEVTGPETGQLREVQVPGDVLEEYFGIDRTDAYFMTFRHADGIVERNRPLAVYLINSTYRISSAKFQEVSVSERPMIVRLDRVDDNEFDVTIILSGTPEYDEAERLLDRGGGRSKRWGLAS